MIQRAYIISIILIISAILAPSVTAQSLTEQAGKAYSEDNFTKALELYDNAIAQDGVSSDILYNIGNCYYRLGNKGKAILYYERALNIDPTNESARENLEFVNSKIIDNTNVDEANIIVELFRNFRDSLSSNSWAIIGIITFLLLIGAIAAYIFSTSVTIRKIGFFGGGLLIICVIVANYFAFGSYNKATDKKYAIITTPSVTLSTSPRTPKDKSEEAFILNEGTKIILLDSVSNKVNGGVEIWLDIKADDSHRAWINKKNIEII